jgi:hypothetical protein
MCLNLPISGARHLIASLSLIALLCFTASPGALSQTRQTMPGEHGTFDAINKVQFTNELETGKSIKLPINRLCDTRDEEGGVSVENKKTIRELLGPDLKSIAVVHATQFETRALFNTAQQAVAEVLQKSPRTLYRYSPWANAVTPDFICRLNWADGKTGELAMTYGYVCFQDHSGKHWWTRFTMPSELNPTTEKGSP